jgi:LCP family protein required for cell wall assembly
MNGILIMNRKRLITILGVEVLIAVGALVFIMAAYWQKPLGPSLDLPPTQSYQVENTMPLGDVIPDGQAAVPDPTATPSSLLSNIVTMLQPKIVLSQPLCGGPSEMTILLIGSDERKYDYYYGLADSIRLVRIDFVSPSVMLLDIPRDLWVDIPDISDHYGITQGKLNQAYFFGNPGMGYYDGAGEGPGLLARTLQQNFGVQVDHYLAMDMKTFVNLIDTLGGIDIHIDSRIDLNENRDGANPELVYEPGDYHLDGTEALRLARSRVPTIFQRARFQDIVLRSLGNKLLNPTMLPLWPQIISQFTQTVQTDLSPSQISQLVCIGQSMAKENITTVAFPDEMFKSGSIYDPYRQVYTYILDVDNNQLRTYFADFMRGTWP